VGVKENIAADDQFITNKNDLCKIDRDIDYKALKICRLKPCVTV
jgi:hypothetical protein